MGTSEAADDLIRWLRQRDDCRLEAGLSGPELDRAAREFGVRFPPLWRRVLAEVLPVQLPEPPRGSDGVLRWTRFPDWRGRDHPGTAELIAAPARGVLFDVGHGFWWREWGPAPPLLDARLAIAGARLAEVPRLVPLWNHWFVADTDASPVFSIVQTDLCVVARTIAELPAGMVEPHIPVADYPVGDVAFWSSLHAWSQLGHRAPFGDLAMWRNT
ncbi:MAG: hypothetical protein ABR604_05090 [Jatrophihabitantaceae bacterium]